MINKTDTSAVVLFVDDDLLLSQVVVAALKEAGHTVHFQSSLAGILSIAQEIRPDIIFLDVEVGDRSSIGIAPELKKVLPYTPIFFISSHTDGETIYNGLATGAVGYLKKPFDVSEILAYVRLYTETRRLAKKSNEVIRLNTMMLHSQSHVLTQGDRVIKKLTNMEFKVLKLLATRLEEEVSSEEIEKVLWEKEKADYLSNIKNYISKLRSYLAEDGSVELQVVYGRGYRLVIRRIED
ncbi:MAG: response regulator transcription factor [Prevotellaceae bacterium]|jgi:DNA-binding response OmpR family regulator|nr:response regulator transcription factor [Prevotellaceae bacterium]